MKHKVPISLLIFTKVLGSISCTRYESEIKAARERVSGASSFEWATGIIEFDSWQTFTPKPWLLEQIVVPTHVLHALGDTPVSFAHGENSASRISNARLATLPAGGHGVFSFERQTVMKEISSFIRDAFVSQL
jgi:pimeloyl-ACP methyl ester carboxylesterase